MAHLDRVERLNSRGWKDGRYYDTPVGLVPSVTTVLSVIAKPALPAWAAKVERELVLDIVHDAWGLSSSADDFRLEIERLLPKAKAHKRELEKAAEIGSEAHAYCEWWLLSQMGKAGPEPKPQHDEALWAAMAFQDWARKVELKPIATEGRVWSEKYLYAGTFDFVAQIDGRQVLGDIKTGKAIYDEAQLQVAALQAARLEMTGQEADCIVVRLPKLIGDPDFEVGPTIGPDVQASLLRTFLHARQLWEWQEQCDKRKKRAA